jgi:two-component system phosphate regulon sensor histidine kinase PhoR
MQKSVFARIVVIIVVALITPVLGYTIFQFMQSNENESLLKSIYQQQLEGILFSVNQHCWDISSTWLNELSSIIEATPVENLESTLKKGLTGQLLGHPGIKCVFVRFSATDIVQARRSYLPAGSAEIAPEKLQSLLSENQSEIKKMLKLAGGGYVKPAALKWDLETEPGPSTLLVFPARLNEKDEKHLLAGFLLDDERFIHEVVARKLSEATGENENFVFAVSDRNTNELIFATDEIDDDLFEKNQALWILPNLDLQVKLSGTTLDDISKSRAETNLILLGIVNVILLFGAIFVVKNVSSAMALAKMKTDFVANVSHELRTPLTLIRMFAEMLDMGRVTSEAKRKYYLEMIVSESARLSQLITNILDFARIESQKKVYRFRPMNLKGLVEETLATYKFHLEQKKFKLEADLCNGLPAANIDSEAIKQAVVNLLDNAIKYSLEEKHIRVTLAAQNKHLVLSVTDRGMGIPQTEQKKIMEKFYRVESSLVHNTKGSGLGLSLVKQIMEVHGGEINVRSHPGKGSTFSLVFPIHQNGGAG